MHYWIIFIGFFIAYFGGSMGAIVYSDTRAQGKSKLRAQIYSGIISIVTAVLFALIVAFGIA